MWICSPCELAPRWEDDGQEAGTEAVAERAQSVRADEYVTPSVQHLLRNRVRVRAIVSVKVTVRVKVRVMVAERARPARPYHYVTPGVQHLIKVRVRVRVIVGVSPAGSSGRVHHAKRAAHKQG